MKSRCRRGALAAATVCAALAALPSGASAATSCTASSKHVALGYEVGAACSFTWNCQAAHCLYYETLYAGVHNTSCCSKTATAGNRFTRVGATGTLPASHFFTCVVYAPPAWVGYPYGDCSARYPSPNGVLSALKGDRVVTECAVPWLVVFWRTTTWITCAVRVVALY